MLSIAEIYAKVSPRKEATENRMPIRKIAEMTPARKLNISTFLEGSDLLKSRVGYYHLIYSNKAVYFPDLEEETEMSGMPAYEFVIKRNGRKPIEVTVTEDGQQSVYLFGCYVTDRQIDSMLPRMVADRKATNNRKRGAKRAS